jgi:hypothetical protein
MRTLVTFGESVTVKGRPRLVLRGGGFAEYRSGSGSDTLVFASPDGNRGEVAALDLHGGAVVATKAAATPRAAGLAIPGATDS